MNIRRLASRDSPDTILLSSDAARFRVVQGRKYLQLPAFPNQSRPFVLRIIIPLSLAILVGVSSLADAQDQRARRRAFVEDLLRGLIDSQTPNEPEYRRTQPGIPQARPGVPGRAPQPKQPRPKRVVVEASPKMVKSRKTFNKWNETTGLLIEEIRLHEYESPQLRPLLGDALKVKADIEVLCRKSQLYPNLAPLQNEFKVLDADWRMLSYRLKSSGALTKKCSGYLDSISALDQELCGIFQIQPQINRAEIQRLATKLSADYEHLLHDLYYVCRGQPNGRAILASGQELQAIVTQACALIGRGNYESIVSNYKTVMGKWKAFHRQIHPFEDERIRRAVAEMEITGGLLREQLWLPVELDRQYLAILSNDVAADAGKVFQSITLAQLMECEAPGRALNSAREFQHACANFSHSISSGAPLEELKWDYRLFEVQWNQMNQYLEGFGVRKVDNRLADIDYAMATLRKNFGTRPVIDYNQLCQLTGNLGAMFQQASQSFRRYVVEPRYKPGFQTQICAAADACSLSARQLNQRLIRNPKLVLKKQDLNTLFVQWRKLKPLINQCQGAELQRFQQFRSQIEPLMVKLQVVYAE